MTNTLVAHRRSERRPEVADGLAQDTNYRSTNNPVADVDVYAPIEGLSSLTRYLLSDEGRHALEVKTARLDAERRPHNTHDRERYIAHLYLCHSVTDFYVARERAQSSYLRPSTVAKYRAHMEQIALDVQAKVEALFPDVELSGNSGELPQTAELEEDDSLPLEPLTDVIEELSLDELAEELKDFAPKTPEELYKRAGDVLGKPKKDELTRARRACMAAVNKAGLSTDSLTMCGAYLNYFNEYAGTTRKNWTVAMWRKMKNAVSAGIWRGESGQWIRVSYRKAA